jgi:hypothetical protein
MGDPRVSTKIGVYEKGLIRYWMFGRLVGAAEGELELLIPGQRYL